MEGCYSCVNNYTCIVCAGGYLLNDDKLCEIMAVSADEEIDGMKLITEYEDENSLTHSLLANQMSYSQREYSIDEWNNKYYDQAKEW